MIQKLIEVSKDKLHIMFRFHHQLNLNHDIIVFLYTKCSLIGMFLLVKDESNTLILAFLTFYFTLESYLTS
jgi:hypothetical protein